MTLGQILFEIRATQKRTDGRTRVNLNARHKCGGTKTYLPKLCMVTPVNFGGNPASILTCDSGTFILCRDAAYMQAICTTRDVKFHWNPTSSWPVKAKQDLTFYSPGGHFVQRCRTCLRYAQLGLVMITHVKFHWNPTCSLTCKSYL
jgi:hypothetical protein